MTGRAVCAATAIGLVAAACGGGSLPPSSGPASDRTEDIEVSQDSDTTVPQTGADVQIDATASGVPFDRRLLGSNLPAWLGPDRLRDPEFQAEAVATGTTLVRLPGGSWSNIYDWRACEVADDTACEWPWAARPSDFVAFLAATGLPASWTVSINSTAQEAAAAVAFFNGQVGDTTPIGVDRAGVDWADVDTWASLRAAGGHLEPVTIELWEVGNEVYGGKPSIAGPQCASYGWEDVWTCDGTAYVTGDDGHDGYLSIRAAMKAVDPEIEVGAVGVPHPSKWNNWGNEVIAAAGDNLDFYVVHQYAFDSSPSIEDALGRAQELWPDVLADVSGALPDETPVAVTEYNLVASPGADSEETMTQAVNALYIADTIGQLGASGVDIANQWNLADGIHDNGTSYGLFSADEDQRFPQFHAIEMWSRAGSTLLPPVVGGVLRVYPTRHEDGRLTILVTNSGASSTATFDISGIADGNSATATHVGADDPTAAVMTRSDVRDLGSAEQHFEVELPAYSISVIEVTASS